MLAALKKFTTKRFVLSASGIGVATAALWAGHMNGETWVYAFAVALAGHHAEDIVRAMKAPPGGPPQP